MDVAVDEAGDDPRAPEVHRGVGLRRGARAGVKDASEAIMTKVTEPATMAQMIVHTETCTDCGPKVKAEMVKARAMGVPSDHPDRLTGQYL